MSLKKGVEVSSGGMFGPTVNGLEQSGTGFVEPLCGIVVAHGGCDGVEFLEGKGWFEELVGFIDANGMVRHVFKDVAGAGYALSKNSEAIVYPDSADCVVFRFGKGMKSSRRFILDSDENPTAVSVSPNGRYIGGRQR